MSSRLSIEERIKNAEQRSENTLNLSFRIKDVHSIANALDVNETVDKVERLVDLIVKKILE